MNEAQTRKDLIDPAIEKAGWTKVSLPLLAGERLEVGFAQVLDAAEEGDVFSVKAARFVDEYADFVCRCHIRAKNKMKAGIAPRQQRRLLRLPMTPVLPFVKEYYSKKIDFAQGGVFA